MIVLIAVAALTVIGLAVALGFGAVARLSVHRSDPTSTVGGRALPEGEIVSDDVEHVRFDVALRGYRMDQVDEVVDRLRLRMAELEEELAAQGPRYPFFAEDGEHSGGSVSMFPVVRRDASDPASGPARLGAAHEDRQDGPADDTPKA